MVTDKGADIYTDERVVRYLPNRKYHHAKKIFEDKATLRHYFKETFVLLIEVVFFRF